MTLVVAQVLDGRITVVADTKITFTHDVTRTRQVYVNALPKIVIVRRDLCVAYAGNDPEGVLEALTANRGLTFKGMVELAIGMPHADFLIASLEGLPSLIAVHEGKPEDRTTIGRAWAGNRAAYDRFRKKETEYGDRLEDWLLFWESMREVTESGDVDDVGGYVTVVWTEPEGFSFLAGTTVTALKRTPVWVTDAEGKPQLSMETAEDADPWSTEVAGVPGTGDTFGALACFMNPPGLALLFPHDAPGDAIKFRATSIEDVIEQAAREHGQQLRG